MALRGPAWLIAKVFDLKSIGPGFAPNWILWVFHGSILWQDTSDPSLVREKPRKEVNNVSGGCDVTEILLLNPIHSINQSTNGFYYHMSYAH